MRRGLGFVLVVGGVLLGGVALAQQGLIVDPWARHAPRALTPSDVTGVAAKAQRASAEPASAAPARPKALREEQPALAPSWKPGAPVDVVDPWAVAPATPVVTAAAPGSSWATPLVDLVDPWAAERSSAAPPAAPRTGIY